MANQTAKIFNIDFKSPLITTQNKNQIMQFNGFTKRNNPFLNGGLKKFNVTPALKQLSDKDGNIYSFNNGNVYKNNSLIKQASDTFIKIDEVEIPGRTELGLSENILYATPYSVTGGDFFLIQTATKFYVFKKTGNSYSQIYQVTGNYTLYSNKKCLVAYLFDNTDINLIVIDNISNTANKVTFTMSDSVTDRGLNFAMWGNYFIARTVESNNQLITVDPTDSSTVDFVYFDVTDTTDKGTGTVDNRCFFENDYYLVNTVATIDNTPGYTNVDDYVTMNNGGTLTEKGRCLCTFSSGVITVGAGQTYYIQYPRSKGYMSHNVVATYDGNWDVSNDFTGYFHRFTQETTKVIVTPDCIKYCNRYHSRAAFANYSYRATYANQEDAEEDYSLNFDNTGNDGSTQYFVNYYAGNGNIVLGGGCNISASDPDFSENYTIADDTSFSKVYQSNTFANLSWCGKIFEPWLEINTDYIEPIYCPSFSGYFYFKNNQWYKVYEAQTATIKIIYDRYLLILAKLNSGDIYNLYDTQTDSWFNFASDWNNRVLIGVKNNNIDYSDVAYSKNSVCYSMQIGTGENIQWKRGSISSAIWNPVIYNNILPPGWAVTTCTNDALYSYINLNYNSDYIASQETYFSVTLNGNAVTSTPYYVTNWNNTSSIVDIDLVGLIFPLETDGNIIFNISLLVDFITTSFNINYIKTDTSYYQLITQNNVIILVYAKGTQLTNISEIFCLQGNTYIIQNDYICSCLISDNVVSNITTIISCEYLTFLGASLDTAYFFSEADRKIFLFTGNRQLEELTEYSNISNPIKSFFSIYLNTFFIIVSDKVICISNNEYIYEIKGSYIDYQTKPKGVTFFDNTMSYYYSIYDGLNYNPVTVKTALYGFGNNQVTIIDTWYVRLYADEAFNGSIKLKVTSLTNKGTESEETEFLITADMFDKVTNSYYLRYQPKLQRGVGLSLSIESDYDIIELSCSAIADTTVQLSKPFSKQNVINGGKI